MRRWLSLTSLIVSLAAVVLLAVLWARSQAGWASVRWRAREGDVFELWVAEARAGSVGMAWCRVTAEPSVHGGSDYTGGFSIASDQQMIVRWRAEPGQRVRVWFED